MVMISLGAGWGSFDVSKRPEAVALQQIAMTLIKESKEAQTFELIREWENAALTYAAENDIFSALACLEALGELFGLIQQCEIIVPSASVMRNIFQRAHLYYSGGRIRKSLAIFHSAFKDRLEEEVKATMTPEQARCFEDASAAFEYVDGDYHSRFLSSHATAVLVDESYHIFDDTALKTTERALLNAASTAGFKPPRNAERFIKPFYDLKASVDAIKELMDYTTGKDLHVAVRRSSFLNKVGGRLILETELEAPDCSGMASVHTIATVIQKCNLVFLATRSPRWTSLLKVLYIIYIEEAMIRSNGRISLVDLRELLVANESFFFTRSELRDKILAAAEVWMKSADEMAAWHDMKEMPRDVLETVHFS